MVLVRRGSGLEILPIQLRPPPAPRRWSTIWERLPALHPGLAFLACGRLAQPVSVRSDECRISFAFNENVSLNLTRCSETANRRPTQFSQSVSCVYQLVVHVSSAWTVVGKVGKGLKVRRRQTSSVESSEPIWRKNRGSSMVVPWQFSGSSAAQEDSRQQRCPRRFPAAALPRVYSRFCSRNLMLKSSID